MDNLYSNDETSWADLPNEMKALIIEKMDIQSRVALKASGFDEAALVRKFGKCDVNICVKYFSETQSEKTRFVIELKDVTSVEPQLTWTTSECEESQNTMVLFKNVRTYTIILGKKLISTVTSGILQKLLAEPMFVVKKLEFQLNKFEGVLNFGSIVASLEALVLNECSSAYTAVNEILGNKNLKFKGILGLTPGDCYLIEYNWRSTYKRITTWFEMAFCEHFWHWYTHAISLEHSQTNFQISSFEKALEKLNRALNKATPFIYVMRRESVRNKTELARTVNDIMYFRVAYSYQLCDPAPYLKATDPNFEEKISFLKAGLTDHCMNNCQLAALTMSYLFRLLRGEPELDRINDKVSNVFRLVFQDLEEFHYHEKLVEKIEIMVNSEI